MSDYRDFKEACSKLWEYAVEVRYSGEEEPSVEKACEMISAADRIYRFIREVLALD